MSRIHRYPARTLLADYGRGVVGAGVSGVFWALSPVAIYSMVLFGGLTTLFLLFTLRTWMRQRQRVATDEAGIGAAGIGGAGGTALAWDALDELRLHYYAMRRSKPNGWMTMTLGSRGRRLKLDSTLEGFEDIAARALAAANGNGVALSETTRTNLAALGLPPARAGVAALAGGRAESRGERA